jgi:hypothetical protein
MDAEQTQSEGGLPGWEEKALEALRWDWDTAYMIDHDDEHGWYAGRRDRIGELITADDPDALRRKIAENYAISLSRENRTDGRRPGRHGTSWAPTQAS